MIHVLYSIFLLTYHTHTKYLVARMTKTTFQKIYDLIKTHSIFENQSQNQQTDAETQLLVALERFGCSGNGASVGRVARSFGVGNGTVSLFTSRIIIALCSHFSRFIYWPTAGERRQMATRILNSYGIPDCVGVLDGTHVNLSQIPALEGELYWTRKCRYAFNLQLIVDEQRKIRFVGLGWPGSVHDWTAFKDSSIATSPRSYLSPGQYILADFGYVTSGYILTPYSGRATSDPDTMAFSAWISSFRVVVEHANGILKNRWASLDGLRVQIKKQSDISYAIDWIESCCVLHT